MNFLDVFNNIIILKTIIYSQFYCFLTFFILIKHIKLN